MSALVDTGFAKLNLALHVRARRPDGRHELETLFVFCEDGDLLSAEPADDLMLTIDGPFAEGLQNADNLVLAAADALRRAAGIEAGAKLHLDKRLPVASGIGGGSADAAAALRLLTQLWDVEPGLAAEIALRLGADVPACLLSKPCRGTEAGDKLEAVDLSDLVSTPVLLVNPRVPLSTRQVFAAWAGSDRGALDDWRHGRNDLEVPAKALVPQIALLLAWLENQGGVTVARMSGSGATCFALFEDEDARDQAAAAVPREWWHLATRLR